MGALVQLAPAILGFLGGPAGGLAGAALEWLAGKLGASDKTQDAIKAALDGFKPEDSIKLRELDIQFHEFCLENGIRVDLAQIAVNQQEAQSMSLFVAGWRPFVGWTCGAGLAYVAIIEPVARFAATMAGYAGAFPAIDTSLTMQVLLGMLGLGALRTFEKKEGVARG